MFEKLDDTIFAVSSPMGPGQRGVIRLSGSAALRIASRLFRPANRCSPEEIDTNKRLRGHYALSGDEFLLPGEMLIFLAPRSYTREDVVEIHTAGAPALLALLLDRVVVLGARLAEPGEFTARAFCHGAMGLTQVEGVAALINARSDEQLRAAHHWLDGHLAGDLEQVRQELVELVSLVEADIDFAEEPIDFVRPEQLSQRIGHIMQRLQTLLQETDARERSNYLPRVMLLGAPNAGKSTLMNCLSGIGRAVCSPVEGTTRDFLTAVVQLAKGEFELIDTPGLAQNPEKSEKISKIFFTREIAHMDMFCRVLDLTSSPLTNQVSEAFAIPNDRTLWVANKSDLVDEEHIHDCVNPFIQKTGSRVYVLSAATGHGVESLRSALQSALFDEAKSIGNQRFAVTARHRRAVRLAHAALARAAQWCASSSHTIDCAEWVATDLRDALSELGTLLGEVTTDDFLDHIFAGFCIGK